MSRAINELINHRLLHLNLAIRGLQQQVTSFADNYFLRAFERQSDNAGIDPWSNHKVVFKLSLIAVVNKIHAFVNIPVVNPSIAGNIDPPLGWIIPDKVVALAR